MTQTLPRMVLAQAKRLGNKTALRRKTAGVYGDISWAAMAESIRDFGKGLLALGLEPEDRVAIMAPNSPDWLFADLGALACGGVTAPVYHTEGLEAIHHIINDSGCRFVLVQSPLLAAELLEARAQTPELEQIILLEGEAPGVLSREQFLAAGQAIAADLFEQRLAAGRQDDLASLVYTSGTTGPPKGVMLSHGNFLSNVAAAAPLFPIGEQDTCLSFLPLSHVFERMAGYYLMLHQGATIAYAESIDTVPANLGEIQPTLVISVPRLYEKMYARVMERALNGPWVRKQIFFWGLGIGRRQAQLMLAGHSPGVGLQLAGAVAKRLVFSKLQAHMGGKLGFFVSGGAPLGKEIAEFFLAAGIPIYEGYGLTETSPVIAANCPAAIRLGTVGRPIPGTEVRIVEDGEILVRGPGIFQGYWNNPAATAEAMVDDWFKTGDIGVLDTDGFLAITDRKKDLIVTAGGKNIAPQNLENLFKTDKYLANAMVYGDRKPYLTALLVPNLENLEKYARFKKIDFIDHCDLVGHPQILDLIRRRINALQQEMPNYQTIKRFTLLSSDFSKELVTPTLKIKRKQVNRHYQSVLEGMYLAQDLGVHDSGFCVVAPNNEKGSRE